MNEGRAIEEVAGKLGSGVSDTADLSDLDRLRGGRSALLVVDHRQRVLMCGGALRELTGDPPGAVCGRLMSELLTDPQLWPSLTRGGGGNRRAELRHRDGRPVRVRVAARRVETSEGAAFLAELVPASLAERWEENDALIRALFQQTRVGLAIHDLDLMTTRLNLTPQSLGPPTAAGVEVRPLGRGIEEILLPEDAAAVRERLRKVAETGEPVVDWIRRARRRNAPERERVISLSAFRLQDAEDQPMGVAVVFTDVTEQHLASQRILLLHAAAERIGRSLDVPRVATELADVMVSGGFADLAAVDLTRSVLEGEEPGDFRLGEPIRRVAVASADGSWPPEIYPLGAVIRPRSLESDHLRAGSAAFTSDLAHWREALAEDPERSRLLLPHAATSFMAVPLIARGLVLGALVLWRTDRLPPFGRTDADLAEEIASRASLAVDNARRYTREHRTAETLQRGLLPRPVVETCAAQTAGSYVPAGSAARIGGSWFDVIPLSSTRVAFVLGDVAGYGLAATATMGRLRTAVQTLADLELAPGELLTHLDDLVIRLADAEQPEDEAREPAGEWEEPDAEAPAPSGGRLAAGTTCLYCVYDPVQGSCTIASAGHPAPVLAGPDGVAAPVGLKPGPPLGVGGMPFEPVEFAVAPGSLLAFFTRPLLSEGDGTPEPGMARLCALLSRAVTGSGTPSEIGQAVLDGLLPKPPTDDVSLLIARTRAVPAEAVAAWEFPADFAVVARARALVGAQLAAWDLEHLSFTTELIASELVTNAIRYGGAPVGLRLIRAETLICEVSDPSQTQPHLRRARLTDEGGRGLFLIAQLAHRWGSRYTPGGKTIWTEQPLGPVL